MHNALACRVRCDDFRIVRFDGAGVDHGLGLGDIFGSLPEFNGDAQRFKSVGFGAVRAIGAVHRDSFGVQHFGQNAHTGAADTDEMGGAEIRGAGRSIERGIRGVKHDGLILRQFKTPLGIPAPYIMTVSRVAGRDWSVSRTG